MRSPVPSSGLSSSQVRELRAKAHSLKPVVWVAQNGVSAGVLRELDRALTAHELIKIHAALDDRAGRQALLQSICHELHAEPVQVIGKMLVAFRPRPDPQPAAERAGRRTARPAGKQARRGSAPARSHARTPRARPAAKPTGKGRR
jgi:RNA-binding protein